MINSETYTIVSATPGSFALIIRGHCSEHRRHNVVEYTAERPAIIAWRVPADSRRSALPVFAANTPLDVDPTQENVLFLPDHDDRFRNADGSIFADAEAALRFARVIFGERWPYAFAIKGIDDKVSA